MAKTTAASKFIRVETPETTDGVNLAYDENRQPKTKVTTLPATARQELERNASRLPEHLRPKITDVAAPTTSREITDVAAPTTSREAATADADKKD